MLIASSEMPERIGLCDRIVVLRQGRTVAEFPGGADEREVLAAGSQVGRSACGMKPMNEAAPIRAPAPAPAGAWRGIDLFAIAVRFQSVIGLVVVAIGEIIFSPRRHRLILFLAPDNMANIVRAVSETGIIAVGMTFVIITAGIDLSVGALLSLSSVLTATIMTTEGWGLIATVLIVVACGAAFGAMQGVISTRFRLEPFIVTLAGLQVARGLALVISNNQYINISYGNGPGLAPPVFAILGDRLFNNIVPVATLVFVVVATIATSVLNFTRFGRYVFAVGGNERAARLSGVPVTLVKISVYAITGLVSAIAGIVHAGQFNFGSANDGTGYKLVAIAAVVIGGTSLFGGSGSMVGTVAGAVMLGALANVLQLNNINAALQLLATGAIIVARRGASISRPSPRGIGPLNEGDATQWSRPVSGDSRQLGRRRPTQPRERLHGSIILEDSRGARARRGRGGAAGGRGLCRAPRQGMRQGRQVRHRLLAGQQRGALSGARQRGS